MCYNLAWKGPTRFNSYADHAHHCLTCFSEVKRKHYLVKLRQQKQVKKCVHQQCLKHTTHFIFNTRKAELL